MSAPALSIEAALIGYLSEHPDISAPVTVEPWPDFTPPLLAIERVGGQHDGYRVHDAVIDTDAFAATRQSAEALAWEADTALNDLEGQTIRGLVVTRVVVTGSPRAISYGNDMLRRYTATYRLTFHVA